MSLGRVIDDFVELFTQPLPLGAGVKMVSIMITLGAGAFVFKAMRQKITEEEKYGGSKRSAAIPSLKKRTSKKRN